MVGWCEVGEAEVVTRDEKRLGCQGGSGMDMDL
jgi:hypothetical protein